MWKYLSKCYIFKKKTLKVRQTMGRAYFASIKYLIRYFMRWLLARGGLLLQFTRLTFARLSQIHLFARKTSARSSAAAWSHGAPSMHLSQTRFQALKGGETVALAPRSFYFTLYSYPSRRAPVVLHNCLFMPGCLQSIFICAHCRR